MPPYKSSNGLPKRHYEWFLTLLGVLLFPGEVFAYFGPGAGFAVVSSFFALATTCLLVAVILVTWPFRYVWRRIRRRRPQGPSSAKRVVVVGLDGLDPRMCEGFMAEGRLPSLERLRGSGTFLKLGTTFPAVSPVAWSSFATGVNPGKHNIYDFLTVDRRSYAPKLSSAEVRSPSRHLSLGRYKIPLRKPVCRNLRRSKPFWTVLSEYGVSSTILRLPITFPAEAFDGLQISGMCVPDLRGTQGSFTFYTSSPGIEESRYGGKVIRVAPREGRIESVIPGPPSSVSSEAEDLRLPFSLQLSATRDQAELRVAGTTVVLKRGEYSEWVSLPFRAAPGIRIRGIGRFYLKQVAPVVELYLSPINIDPGRPALPISYPAAYSVYLAKLFGKYATLGLAEDTSALNERVLDENAFLQQCKLIHEERERMFFDALDHTERGICLCVFDMPDRVQHMFFSHIDEGHPAHRADSRDHLPLVIRDTYEEMDRLVAKVMERVDQDTIVVVLSDHGFRSFRRGVNLNTWLLNNGYLFLKNGRSEEWLEGVDWAKTRAYALGLGGVFINLKGREAGGIVGPGEECADLKRELRERLTGLRDHERGELAILQVSEADVLYEGPYRENAPDLVVGYNEGYRASWDGAKGKTASEVFEDNMKSWSGDHCIDPRLVPGVLFCNRKLDAAEAHITDIAPTLLRWMGVDPPSYMEGKCLVD